MDFFEEIGKRVTNAGQGVAQQTKNLAEITRLNGKIADTKEKMSQLLFEMGSDYYKKHRKDKDCEEREYIDQINVLFREVLRCQQDIEEIKNAAVCRACGTRIAGDAAFCMSCGARLDADEVEYTEDYNEPARTCPACGAAVDEDCMFCMTCGTKIGDAVKRYAGEAESARIRPVCGAEAEGEDTFCMNCGTKL